MSNYRPRSPPLPLGTEQSRPGWDETKGGGGGGGLYLFQLQLFLPGS